MFKREIKYSFKFIYFGCCCHFRNGAVTSNRKAAFMAHARSDALMREAITYEVSGAWPICRGGHRSWSVRDDLQFIHSLCIA
jgi:hypothetical protein